MTSCVFENLIYLEYSFVILHVNVTDSFHEIYQVKTFYGLLITTKNVILMHSILL